MKFFMKFRLLTKKFLVCILSLMMVFATFAPSTFAAEDSLEIALCIAAENGNLEEVQRLVAAGAKVNDYWFTYCAAGDKPFSIAARNGHSEVVKWFVTEGLVDINSEDGNHNTLLHCAAAGGHLELVDWLVNVGGADINHADSFGNTPLHIAAAHGRLDVVKWLVTTQNVNVDFVNDNLQTPLHLTIGGSYCYSSKKEREKIERGRLEVLRWLVTEGHADVNIKDKFGETPLILATQRGFLDIMKCLVIDG